MKKSLILCVVLSFLAASSIAVVYAAPEYTYDATSNYHGVTTPLNADVIVTATTNDPAITHVTFIWRDGASNIKFQEQVALVAGSAQSTHKSDSIGDWGVQTLFQGPDGKTKEGVELVVKTRAASFHVIPEIPIIGTLGASAAMLLGYVYKTKKQKQK